jgi:hypothetical protein
MTKLLLKLPWFISTPTLLALAAALAFGANLVLSDYFERTFLDEANPLEAAAGSPEPGGTLLAEGVFQDGDPGHNGAGTATILRTADGKLILRFEGFSVTNGPDLFVYLTPDANGDDIDGGINLGDNKATDGNINYEIPDGTDVSKFKSAVIWCRQFRIKFAFATLEAKSAAAEAPAPSSPSEPVADAPVADGGVAEAPTPAAPDAPAAEPTAPPEPEPTAAPSQAGVLAEGVFRDGEPGHNGSGAARLLRAEDGALFLRFEEFSVTNGPDLFVYLTSGGDSNVEAGLNLGRNKATDGNINYEIPVGTDLSQYDSVVIWCDAANITFAVATLETT